MFLNFLESIISVFVRVSECTFGAVVVGLVLWLEWAVSTLRIAVGFLNGFWASWTGESEDSRSE